MATGAIIARIVTQYSDKGSKAAKKDIDKLGKQFDAFGKKVAKSFAVAGAAAAAFALKLGKDAVKAAIEDSKSQALLANTLRNTIGATDDAIYAVEQYIEKQQLLTNVQDTELRESFSKLAVAVGNTSDAMLLQGVALDTAAGTGKDLSVITDAITKATQGNFTALKKLVPTLDANIVKNKDLGAALVYLNKTYKGAAEAAANQDPWTKLSIAFSELKEKLGVVLLPEVVKFINYLTNTVFKELEYWIWLNENKIKNALETVARNIKDIVVAFQNIYGVFKGINDLLPIGIGGWIQLAVAIKGLTLVLGGLNTVMAIFAIRAKMNKSLVDNLLLGNRKFMEIVKESTNTNELAVQSWYRLKGAILSSTPGVYVISSWNKLKTVIFGFTKKLLAPVLAGLAAIDTALITAAASGNAAAAGVLKFKASLISLVKWIPGWGKAIIVALGLVAAFWDKMPWNKDKVTISDTARKAEFSMYMAAKATTSMDDALNKYKETQTAVVKKTKEQIAEEKRLAALKAKQDAADKKRAKFEADYQKINERIAKTHGVKLLTSEEEKMVQINAAEALLNRQKKIDEINKQKLADLREEVLLRKVVNDLSYRYDDILKALADNKITTQEIQVLALKWGVTTEAVDAYLYQLKVIEDGKISDDEIVNLAMKWGSTQAQAAQYLDFYQALNDGILSDSEIEKLKTKWKLTEDQVRMYADFVGIVNDGKLTDAEIIKIKDKWKLTTDQVVDYILKIGSPVSYSGTLIDPARAAELAWKDATAALMAYLALLAKGTGAVVTGKPDSATIDANAAAAAEAAAAAKAAADAANALAESEAALASIEAAGRYAAAKGYAEAKAAGNMDLAAEFAAQVGPSAVAKGESGAIGAASIAAALKAAEDQLKTDQFLATYAAFQQKERADAAAAQAASAVSTAMSDAAADAAERARMRNLMGLTSASSTVATAGSISGGGNLMAGGNVNVTVNVSGSVTSEQDLVSAVRNGLLQTQYNGNPITLLAV